MALQGPVVIVGDEPNAALVAAFTAAGAFPVVEARWLDAPAAVTSIQPSAVITDEPHSESAGFADALAERISQVDPFLPMIVRLRGQNTPPPRGALPIAADATPERLIARVSSVLRIRTLHATVLDHARALKAERGIYAEFPADDPLESATVLVAARGPAHPALSLAVGERTGVVGALSLDAATRSLEAREIDGIVIGDGLPGRGIERFLTWLGEDSRFRDLPLAILRAESNWCDLPNFVHAADPRALVARMVPLVRLRAFESALKRLLQSIECKGVLDPRTGLLLPDVFGQDLIRAIEDSAERGVGLSLARFSFEPAVADRSSLDAARLLCRLMRRADLACREEDDGSILVAFTDTDLRAAHVVARRLASALKHTMLRPAGRASISPAVTLATLKPNDTVLTLLARVGPLPVAAA